MIILSVNNVAQVKLAKNDNSRSKLKAKIGL